MSTGVEIPLKSYGTITAYESESLLFAIAFYLCTELMCYFIALRERFSDIL